MAGVIRILKVAFGSIAVRPAEPAEINISITEVSTGISITEVSTGSDITEV